MPIKTCPTCGKKNISRQTVDVPFKVDKKTVVVKDLELEVCPDCGEKLFDKAANAKVEAALFGKARRTVKARNAS
jgi:YgiT-type zinc finger domain-containing protein